MEQRKYALCGQPLITSDGNISQCSGGIEIWDDSDGEMLQGIKNESGYENAEMADNHNTVNISSFSQPSAEEFVQSLPEKRKKPGATGHKTIVSVKRKKRITIPRHPAVASGIASERDRFNRYLIMKVHRHRNLWSSEYNHRSEHMTKDEIWRQVAKELGLNETESVLCKERWQLLRKSFIRIHRSLPSPGTVAYEQAKEKVCWPYYPLMEFLVNHMNRREHSATVTVSPTPADSNETGQSVQLEQGGTSAITPFLPYDDNEAHVSTVSSINSTPAESDLIKSTGSNPNYALGELICSTLTQFHPTAQIKLRSKIMRFVSDLFEDAASEMPYQ